MTLEEEARSILNSVLWEKPLMNMDTIVHLKNALNDLSYRRGVDFFYVYYSQDDIGQGRINITQNQAEFIGARNYADLHRKSFTGV